ncbi:MAG: fibrobacter succinogenes major paralogous domain-containing protein [Dysgonamonadaceae bacterium]|jgi:uncharacterized protein (TIGR02145 family)|nr:fibrobacter succinogenes major paralogous domain-containing protein [Dysgonamonadaceae bacterium]
MKQKMMFLALTLWILSAASMNAQVTIGSEQDPHKGAVLDLSQSTNLGLLLPQVFLTNVSDWQLSGNEANGEGMLIYNTNDDVPDGNGKDIYVWTRSGWKPIGPVSLKRFELDKSLLFLDMDGETGTITAQNFTGSDDKPFGSVTVSWSVVASAVPDGASISPVDNTFTVTSGSTAGSFTVRATAGGVTQDCVVTISECTGVMDVEGNAYYAAQFGVAGCWMTQNLRSKKTALGTSLTENGDPGTNTSLEFYWYPGQDASVTPAMADDILEAHPEYGLLYTWAAATTGRSVAKGNEGEGESYAIESEGIQGICPSGWHLPSDREWNQLEEVIAKSAANEYSITGPVTWETSYNTTSANLRGYHGQKMKSSTTAVNGQNPNGTSKSYSEGGFDVLLVGLLSSGTPSQYGTRSYLWSSSYFNATNSWRRYLQSNFPGVCREATDRCLLRSVRCKKN